MESRKELITSREYWVALIHINLWNINGSVEADSDKWELVAEKTVDENFMNVINELSKNKDMPTEVEIHKLSCEYSLKHDIDVEDRFIVKEAFQEGYKQALNSPSSDKPSDTELLDWLQNIMTSKDNYCEVFFAGLREGHNDATAFQIESNPERFETLHAKNIRDAIRFAMNNYKLKE